MNHSRPTRFPGVIAALLASALLSSPAAAGIGDIDPAYGDRGILTNRGDLNMMTPMPDGRVMTASYFDGYLNIYMADANGRPDAGFGLDGHQSVQLAQAYPYVDLMGTAAAVASNGSIYLAFDTGNLGGAQLVRVNAAGALDFGFGVNGVVAVSVPSTAAPGSTARILSIAPWPDGQVAVLVGYFRSAYDCASDLRVFRMTSGTASQLEYDHAALQAAVVACSEFGGVTLTALPNGNVMLQVGDVPTVFDPSGRPVALHLEQTGISGNSVSLSPDPTGNHVYVAGPTTFMASGCAVARTTPDLAHTGIDDDGDDWFGVDFSSVPGAQAGIRSCRILAGKATGNVYVEALLGGADGRAIVAIARVILPGYYYPDLDRRFGNQGIAVLGMEAAFALFAEQADGSLLLSHGGYAGGPAHGGDAVVRLLGSNLPSPGMILLEAPPYPVLAVQGTPAMVNVRRALGSQGAVTATYVVTAQHDGPPLSFSPVQNLEFAWRDGEQGSKSMEALSAKATVGHYDVDPTSTPDTVFFHDHGSFSIVASGQPPAGGGSTGSGAAGGSGAPGIVGSSGGGGGSVDCAMLLLLACLMSWRLSAWPTRYSRSRSR